MNDTESVQATTEGIAAMARYLRLISEMPLDTWIAMLDMWDEQGPTANPDEYASTRERCLLLREAIRVAVPVQAWVMANRDRVRRAFGE